MKKLMLTVCLGLGLLIMIAPMAMAYTVTFTGNRGTTGGYNGYGPYQTGQGGEFTVKPSSDLPWALYAEGVTKNITLGDPALPNFQTFCVEDNEFISGWTTYTAFLNDKAIAGGVTPPGDLLSKGTAWLYYQFSIGALSGYQYSGSEVQRETSAALLQNAIWYFEGEGGENNYYVGLAETNLGSSVAWENNLEGTNRAFPVMVLNLYSGSSPAQDVLVTVPEPGILILLGIALSAVGLAARRFKF